MKRFRGEIIVVAVTAIFLITAVLLYWNRSLFSTEITVQEAQSVPREGGAGLEDKDDYLLDLNAATIEQMMEIPGISKELAERILRYREQNGGFRTVWELDSVAGIGTALMEKLEPYFFIP